MMRQLVAVLVVADAVAIATASFGAQTLLDPDYRVVIPIAQAKTFLQDGCSALPQGIASKVSGFWTPDEATIALADQHLPIALQNAIRNTPSIGPVTRGRQMDWEVIANHTRQYTGIVMDGRKLVLVVGAPIYVVDFDGRHDMVTPQVLRESFVARGDCDGGSRQFSALYDPARDSYGDFHFSGGYHEP